MNFQQATERVKTLTNKPSDETMLQLYGLYKQATVGDVNTDRPSFWDLVGKAKWDSWDSYKGLSMDDAKTRYTDLVQHLVDSDF
jgi:acyl-CoA-binding protein